MKLSSLRPWLIPTVLLAGAVVGVLVLWPRDVKPPRMDESELRPAPPVPAAPVTEADRFEVRNRHGEFAFERRAEGWTLVRPFTARANHKLLVQLLERLGKLEFGIVVSRDPKNHEQEKVAGKLAVEVRLGKGSQPLWHVFLGKSSDFTLVRVADSAEIWQVRGALRQQFVRDAAAWLDPQLMAEPVDQVRSVSYLLPDRGVLVRFLLEKPGEPTLAEGSSVKVFDPSRVTGSLARLSQLRLHRVEIDPPKMKERTRVLAGGVEVEYASGRAQRFLLAAAEGADTPILIEERASGSGKFQEAQHLAVVHSHMLRGLLFSRSLDLESHLVFATPEEPVAALRGRCEGFTYELERDGRGVLVAKASSQPFALARSSVEGFFRFLGGDLLTAAAILLPQEVPAGHGVTPESDFVELDMLQDGKKSTVRIAWGPLTPVDQAGIRYHYVTSSARPNVVFQVMDKKIIPICRTKLTWQLKAEDAEYLPVPGRLVQ
jgi:hypothetical protein